MVKGYLKLIVKSNIASRIQETRIFLGHFCNT